MKRLLAILLGLSMVLCGCTSAEVDAANETLYPSATYADGVYVWCAVPGTEINGIRYYNTVTDTTSSLCTDPLCNHFSECYLFRLYVNSIIAHDGMIYANVIDFSSADSNSAIIRYDFNNQSRKDLVVSENRGVSQHWCISGDYIYYLKRDEHNTSNIFRIQTNGHNEEQITFYTDSSIYDFKVYNGDIFYAKDNMIYRNDELFFTIPDPILTFQYYLYDGYFYYTVNNKQIKYSEDGDLPYNYVLHANSKANVYRLPIDNPQGESELVLENVKDKLTFYDQYIYYNPFTEIQLAFKYIMSDTDEYTYIYNSYDSTYSRFNLNEKKNEILFKGKDLLINHVAALTDQYIIAYCVPYADAKWIDEEAREVDSYFYMDNADYYKLTYDGEVVGRVGFYENERGVIK